MDTTLLLLLAAAALSLVALCALVWLLSSILFSFFRPSLRVHQPTVGFSALVALALIGFMLLAGAIISAPWDKKSRWTNGQSLESTARPVAGLFEPKRPSPLIPKLIQQIGDDGTVVALAISGGGSRAAYFAANVLERLSHVRWPGGKGSSLTEHINLVSSVSGGSFAAAYFACTPLIARTKTLKNGLLSSKISKMLWPQTWRRKPFEQIAPHCCSFHR